MSTIAPTAPSSALVECIRLSKVYPPDVTALKDISLAVQPGEIVYLTGQSGAGKTTMLKMICNLEIPSKGMVVVAGRDLARLRPAEMQRLRQKIGVAYQDFRLLPKLTAFQNVAMPLEVAYQKRRLIRQRVGELLEGLGIGDKSQQMVENLSRGEQQRVALARAAANSPALLLADEPTGNLDGAAAGLVVELFQNLAAAGSAVIVATHDVSLYRHSNHRVFRLAQGELSELATHAARDHALDRREETE